MCGCPIDWQVNNTVEVQKRMKSIARDVHPKKIKITNKSSPLCLSSPQIAILDITRRRGHPVNGTVTSLPVFI